MTILSENPKLYKQMLEEFCAITYPEKTLRRRISFLTDTEKRRVIKLEKQITDVLDKIDGIIATRAEIMKDRWP